MTRLAQSIRGMSGQPLRYAIAGAVVAITYLSLTLFAAGPLGIPIQAAMPVSYALATALHFTLQRYYVFRSHTGFALAFHAQAGSYVVLGLIQYAFTATMTAVLPEVLGIDERIVYVGAVCVATVFGFLVLRLHVFRSAPATTAPASSD